MMKRWFHRTVLSRRWLTFIVMGIAFFVFGVGTYNIFMLLSANIDLIAHYGWMAVMDGAARQFLELILTGYLSMAAYVIFKTCEYRLAHALADTEAEQVSDTVPVETGCAREIERASSNEVEAKQPEQFDAKRGASDGQNFRALTRKCT